MVISTRWPGVYHTDLTLWLQQLVHASLQSLCCRHAVAALMRSSQGGCSGCGGCDMSFCHVSHQQHAANNLNLGSNLSSCVS